MIQNNTLFHTTQILIVIRSSRRPLPDNTLHSQERESKPPAGFEPTIPVSGWTQTHPLNRAATGTGKQRVWFGDTETADSNLSLKD